MAYVIAAVEQQPPAWQRPEGVVQGSRIESRNVDNLFSSLTVYLCTVHTHCRLRIHTTTGPCSIEVPPARSQNPPVSELPTARYTRMLPNNGARSRQLT